MSGLTVGYLRVLSLELKITTGTDQEKEYAAKVLPILSNRHWLLCTLLLMNSFANEAMPVFLDRIFNRFTAVVISVTLLLVFGEVIPQALCTSPHQIQYIINGGTFDTIFDGNFMAIEFLDRKGIRYNFR